MHKMAKVVRRTTGYRDKLLVSQVEALIDADYYLRNNEDVASAGLDPAVHYFENGWAEGRNPCALFDTEWYFERYPDVVAAGLNPLVHYLREGANDARNPHPLFDTQWYLDANKDVKAAGLNPLVHYLNRGWKEGRNPNPIFNADWYARTHDLPHGEEPLSHYIEIGVQKGLKAAELFDGNWYLEQNPDVAAAGMNPLTHYVLQGWRERRSPDAMFDARWYAQTYLQSAGNNVDPLADYLHRGEQSGASPNRWFDAAWYLETYPDVAGAGLSALQHFIASGALEQRRASSVFHTDFYVSQCPEAGSPGVNPLRHYIMHGRSKGIAATADDASRISPACAKEVSVKDTSPAKKVPSNQPQINVNAGEVIAAPCDAEGVPHYPPIRVGDGRRFARMRIGSDHRWYDDARTKKFIDTLGPGPILPGVRRLLVIGHDLTLTTGVMRPLAHYLNALEKAGGIELTTLELTQGADALVASADVETHDFVIINSLPLFFNHSNAFELLDAAGRSNCAIYLHETDYIFDKLEREKPAEYAKFAEAAKNYNFLTVSQRQKEMLERRFGVTSAYLVANTSPIASLPPRAPKESRSDSEPLSIIMAGTLQPRKGVTLFSEVADLAHAAGLPWRFSWAGGEVGQSKGLYRSENVDFLGNLEASDMALLLQEADVFFLSSVDDPFPLACLEALQMHKRCVVYSRTGTAEVVEDIDGCGVYESHTAEAAFAALKKAVGAQLDVAAVDNLNARFSLEGFAATLRNVIGEIMEGAEPSTSILPADDPVKVAAIVHLFYHDIWDELAGKLENLQHLDADLYVTLTNEKAPEELAEMRERILRRWPDAEVLIIPNQGMDVGPFVEVARSIDKAGRHYDYVLKLHSKKSLEVSGEEHGKAWRNQLLEGLAGSPTDVDRILSIFTDHPEVGMIGPRGMILEKSSRDLAAGTDLNAPNMAVLADRMGLTDRDQRFFRGTMFWARAEDLFEPLRSGGLTIEDFEPGHQPDNSFAHAMERLFACMVRHAGRSLLEYDRTLPKSIGLLKDRHKGEDIYIIAAGASAGHIDPDFFSDKTTIGVNRVFVRFPCKYVMMKEFADAEYDRELVESGATPVVAKWDAGGIKQGKMRPNLMSFRNPHCYFFDHYENQREKIDLSPIDNDGEKLVVSYSTITSAIHLAAYMGARSIILVGHDCGTLDGEHVFEGYYRTMAVSPWKSSQEYADWLTKIEGQTLAVKAKMDEVYGVQVMSINPFINFGLEGRRYDRSGRLDPVDQAKSAS